MAGEGWGEGGNSPQASQSRRRKHKSDVTWIEQLISKRDTLGLDRIIAVSARSCTPEATALARERFIELMELSQFHSIDWQPWLQCENFVYRENCVGIVNVQVILHSLNHPCNMPLDAVRTRNHNMEMLIFTNIWHSSCASYYANLTPGDVIRRSVVLQVPENDPLELDLETAWERVAAFNVTADVFVREIIVPFLPAETYRNMLSGQVVLGYTETAFPTPSPDGKKAYIGIAKVLATDDPAGDCAIRIIMRPAE